MNIYIHFVALYQGWATYGPRAASNCNAARKATRRKKLVDEYYVYIDRVVAAARDKNHNSFSARDRKKVAHHCLVWL